MVKREELSLVVDVLIEGLSFEAIIGVYEDERQNPQKVVVDAKLNYNYNNGVYIDYERVKNLIKDIVIKKKFYLLEDAIVEIKRELTSSYPQLVSLSIGITKSEIFDDCQVKISG